MAFTQPCFIRRNTEELRGYLTDIGHREIKSVSKNKGEKKYLYTCNGRFSQENEHFIKCLKGYNCETNESLFKDIAALNDSSDYMQWFVKDGVWFLCDRDDWDDCISDLTVGKKFSSNEQRGEWLDHLESFHKATVEELIEHFGKLITDAEKEIVICRCEHVDPAKEMPASYTEDDLLIK